VKVEHAAFKICERTYRQTDRHADRNTSPTYRRRNSHYVSYIYLYIQLVASRCTEYIYSVGLAINRSWVQILLGAKLHNNLGQVVHTSVAKQYNLVPAKGRWCSAAGNLAESNGSLPPGGWLIVTCGLTTCTPKSATDPTSSNEYGNLLFC